MIRQGTRPHNETEGVAISLPATQPLPAERAENVSKWRRICVIGSPGSGKSTLSRKLGEGVGLPVVHLDLLFWQKGWKQTPRESFLKALDCEMQAEEWIIDGHYGSTLRERLGRADCVVFLDYPRRLCLWRVLARQLRRKPRPDLPEGCEEFMDLKFLGYVWRFQKRHRAVTVARIEELPPNVEIVRLVSPKQTAAWLSRLGQGR